MANPWDNDPIVAPAASASATPWANDPIVRAAPALPAAAPAPPSITDKAVGAVQAAMQVAKHTIEGIGGYFGALAGGVGGLAGAIHTAATGGVQPDDPRVRAVTGAPAFVQGNLGREPAPGAIDEASQQGAQIAVQGMRNLGTAAVNASPMLRPLKPALDAQPSAVGQDYADQAEGAIQQVAQAFPQGLPAEAAPALATAGAATRQIAGAARETAGDFAATPIGKTVAANAKSVAEDVSAAGGAAKTAATKAAAKSMGTPDPELVKTAQLADQFPHPVTIPPDRLLTPGVRKAVGQDLHEVAGGGGHVVDAANADAMTKNLIAQLDPTSEATRLTPETFDAAMNKAGKAIGGAYDEAGAIPAAEVEAALTKPVENSVRNGSGDVPRLIQNRFDELMGKVDEDGNIPAQALREWDTDVGKQARGATDDDTAGHLSDIQSAMRDVVKSKLTEEQAQALADNRRRYAYGMLMSGDVAKMGKAGSSINLQGQLQPGKLINPVTSTRAGRDFVASNNGGPLADLARVGQLLDNTSAAVKSPLGHGIVADTARAVTAPVRMLAGQAYNRGAKGVTRMLAPERKTPPKAPPAPPPDLELAPQGPLPPQGGAPAAPGPLGDLTPDWETSPGAAGAPAAPAVDAAGLHPAFDEPVVTTGNRAPPSAGQPGSQIPAVPGRPDLPDAMVSGRPGETAATDAANTAVHEPGAIEARAAQAKAAEPAPAAPAPPAKPEPKPNATESAKLDELDQSLASTKSDIVRETLQKERDRVVKTVAAREAAEKDKAAAAELRTTAMTMTDKTTRDALNAKADKLDPPEQIPAGDVKEGQPEIKVDTSKPAAGKTTEGAPADKPASKAKIPVGKATYVDDAAWREAHGISGDGDAARAIKTREAFDLDPDAVEAAAKQHDQSPRAFDRAVDDIIQKGAPNADAIKPAAEGSQGATAQPAQPSGATGAAGEQPGPDGARAAGADGAPPAAGGPAAEDVEAARKFELKHPRTDDGKFVEAPPVTVAKQENRRADSARPSSDGPDHAHTRVTMSNGDVYHLARLNSTESMGVPGWHLDEELPGQKRMSPASGYLADTRQDAINTLVRKLNESKKGGK